MTQEGKFQVQDNSIHLLASRVVREGGEELAIHVAFWKINPNVSTEDVAKVALKLMEKGLYPPKGVKILADYICPGGKGVTITESKSADSADDFRDWLSWVREKKDIYECYEVHPAVASQDAIKMVLGK